MRAAWLAILLGFAMEALLLLFAAGFGIVPGLGSTVSDLAGKVTWSTLVCAGLALGTAASKARAPLMGLLGLLAAPLAFHASRALQQGVAKTLEEVAAGASIGNQKASRELTARISEAPRAALGCWPFWGRTR